MVAVFAILDITRMYLQKTWASYAIDSDGVVGIFLAGLCFFLSAAKHTRSDQTGPYFRATNLRPAHVVLSSILFYSIE